MDVAVFLVALAVTVLGITAASERVGWPPALVLMGAGIAASFLPFVEADRLHQDIVLFGLLPPLLYSAAINTSLVDFKANRRPILLLSIGLVGFTTVGIAVVVHALIPGIGWPACFAIGAVVAPPDAVAATSIGRRIGLPRRLVSVLEGESLLNDASALVALRMAILAMAGSVELWEIGIDFLRAAVGGVAVGFVVFVVVGWLRRHIVEPLFDSALSFITPFAAYIAAEKVHGSGVVAVVVAGILLAHQAPVLQTASSRVAERLSWRTISFVLEHAVFFLIGLQAQWLLGEVSRSDLPVTRIVVVCVASLAALIALRLIWVFPARYLLARPSADPATGVIPPWTYTFVLGWAGMRGVVTLAAAYLLPTSTQYREVLLLIAFTAVAGTLFIQGLSLPWVARRLGVPPPDPVADALARANLLHQASQAGLEKLGDFEDEDSHGVLATIRARVEQRDFAAWERLGSLDGEETPSESYVRIRQAMIGAERRRVLQIRDTGLVTSEIISDVLGLLDVEESMLDVTQRSRRDVRAAADETPHLVADLCVELRAAGMSHPGGLAGQSPEGDDGPEAPLTCQACVDEGLTWVHLRRCLTCGNVACCDSSVGKHATAHHEQTLHPVMQSAEPGETWRWCYVHQLTG